LQETGFGGRTALGRSLGKPRFRTTSNLDEALFHFTIRQQATGSIAEAFVAGARKRPMMRYSILDPELAEPAIGEVHLHSRQISRSEQIRKGCGCGVHPAFPAPSHSGGTRMTQNSDGISVAGMLSHV
jgi:hypothetical protein